MKALIQRVQSASVSVDGEVLGAIDKGVLILVGFGKEDSETSLVPMAEKIGNLRIFPDEQGRFHLSLLDTGYSALVVSQFTLYGDLTKGRRPDFFNALAPKEAEALYVKFVETLRVTNIKNVQQGRFQAYMQVSLVNDGPVTFLIEM